MTIKEELLLMLNADNPFDMETVSRVEIIDETGRVYVNTKVKDVQVSMQDDNRTMKIFLSNK